MGNADADMECQEEGIESGLGSGWGSEGRWFKPLHQMLGKTSIRLLPFC